MYGAALPHLPLYYSVAMRPFIAFRQKKTKQKNLHSGVRKGFKCSMSLLMCCVLFVGGLYHWLRELYRTDFHKTGIYRSGRAWANAWDLFRLSQAISSWPRLPWSCGFGVCLSAVCLIDCKSCTWPISANPATTEEAGELGRTRGTCFVAHRLELAAVAVTLLWFWWCVYGVRREFVFFSPFSYQRTHTAYAMYAASPHAPL